jgi:predicted nucleic-acid-binding Zn-ribbon protein
MNGRMKCIHCEYDNFSDDEKSILFTGFNISAELKLPGTSKLDYQLILCTNCIIGLFFGILGGMMSIERTATHKIISESLKHAGSRYFIVLNQEYEAQRLRSG